MNLSKKDREFIENLVIASHLKRADYSPIILEQTKKIALLGEAMQNHVIKAQAMNELTMKRLDEQDKLLSKILTTIVNTPIVNKAVFTVIGLVVVTFIGAMITALWTRITSLFN